MTGSDQPIGRPPLQHWLPAQQNEPFVRDAEGRNAEIEVAQSGLQKLAKARAAGKSRHAG